MTTADSVRKLMFLSMFSHVIGCFSQKLYDRVTHVMPLHPFTLAETEELCTSKQPERLSVRAAL